MARTRTYHLFNATIMVALLLCVLVCGCLCGCGGSSEPGTTDASKGSVQHAYDSGNTQDGRSEAVSERVTLSSLGVPDYVGEPAVVVKGNTPSFSEEELALERGYESYPALDGLGRCGSCLAMVGPETLPTEERESISEVIPSGWDNEYYDFVDNGYLYNRCHLVAYCLTGENANERNIVTGTRSLNIDGMLPYELDVVTYVEDTGNHVLYRSTPVFEGDDLVCRGVWLEARSVEDHGEDLSFSVFCYNVQDGVEIDYATGANHTVEVAQDDGGDYALSVVDEPDGDDAVSYVVNVRSGKFHDPGCEGVRTMAEHNKDERTCAREELIEEGYEPCQLCKP